MTKLIEQNIDYKKKYEELAYKVYEACDSFENLEYWLKKYQEGKMPIEAELNSMAQLKKRLGKAIGLTDYLARFDWSIELEKKGER